VLDEAYDLFIDLDATEEQLDFPVLYTNAKKGTATTELDSDGGGGTDLRPLFDCIVETIPAPSGDAAATLQVLVTNIDYSDYVGRLAIGRIFAGTIRQGSTVAMVDTSGEPKKMKVTGLYTFEGLGRTETTEARAGDIIALAGIEGIGIGDTITDAENPAPLPRITVDEPTISMVFAPNTSPVAGREGKYVTSRQIRERLERELLYNVSIKIDFSSADAFKVMGRGELQLAILIEMMRREGFELSVSMPETITKQIDGVLNEPVEDLIIDVPEEFIGAVTQLVGERRGKMTKMQNNGHGRTRIEYRIPSRGLIGFRSQFLTETRGTGLANHIFHAYEPWSGTISKRLSGALVADRAGTTNTYALFNLQPRGTLFVKEGVKVYEDRRERDKGKKAHQHEGLRLRRIAHTLPAARAQPRRGARVHTRRRAGGGNARVDKAPQKVP
jgi:GTP-binding protein